MVGTPPSVRTPDPNRQVRDDGRADRRGHTDDRRADRGGTDLRASRLRLARLDRPGGDVEPAKRGGAGRSQTSPSTGPPATAPAVRAGDRPGHRVAGRRRRPLGRLRQGRPRPSRRRLLGTGVRVHQRVERGRVPPAPVHPAPPRLVLRARHLLSAGPTPGRLAAGADARLPEPDPDQRGTTSGTGLARGTSCVWRSGPRSAGDSPC